MIAVIDYGVGNLFSLKSSLAEIGAEEVVTADAEALRSADKIILPGVGAFGDAADKLRATGLDKVVIEAVEAEATTASGIVLPGTAQEKPQMAVVIAVGPGGMMDGKEVVMQVKVGDKILYNKYAGSEFKLDGKTVTILRQSDVLAIVE